MHARVIHVARLCFQIQEIHQTVSQVNECFKDLADIVAGQQNEIDAVESMIERSHQHARSGLSHVEKASESADAGCTVS
jgi:t-SNARE complex subunit (syntaxin)